MDWRECCEKRIAKNIETDKDLMVSLQKTSENKLKSSEELVMNDVNAASKISLVYDSLRELLEVLALKKGYKIYNHECYTAFLKELIGESRRGDEFDEIRKVRNAINYYGKAITTEEATDVVERIETLRNFILDLLE